MTTTDHFEAIDLARERVAKAKASFTAACEASQRQEPNAGERCTAAIDELNAARQALRVLTDMAPGPWAEMARIGGEQR